MGCRGMLLAHHAVQVAIIGVGVEGDSPWGVQMLERHRVVSCEGQFITSTFLESSCS